MTTDLLNEARALVTGGAGFLGSQLVRALLARGAAVHLLIRRGTNLARLADVKEALTLHVGDLLEAEAVSKALEKSSPCLVFNFAMPHGHPETSPEKRDSLSSGVLGLFNLLETSKNMGLKAFIHAGSTLEYEQAAHPLSESGPLRPMSFRGLVKASQTLLCRQYANEFGLPMRILRPFSVYGPGEQEDRFIPTLMRAARSGSEFFLTAGEVRHDFIFVQDVAAAFLLACQGGSPGVQEFNIGTGREYSNAEVVALMERVSGRKVKLADRPRPSQRHDTAHWVADVTCARRELGFEPRFSLEQGLRETWKWFLQTQALAAR